MAQRIAQLASGACYHKAVPIMTANNREVTFMANNRVSGRHRSLHAVTTGHILIAVKYEARVDTRLRSCALHIQIAFMVNGH